MPIEVRVDAAQGALRTTVAVAGDLDLSTAPELDRILGRVQEAARSVVLDLRELSFLDSSGLRVILAADSRARAGASRLVLVPGPPGVHRVFELTLLDRRLEFVGDPSEVQT